VHSEGRWHFDAQAGAQELVNRRIGRNDIAAIRAAFAYVDAQKAFSRLQARMPWPSMRGSTQPAG
jgi:hypothetical protein